MKSRRLYYQVNFWGKGTIGHQTREYVTSDEAIRMANRFKDQGFKVEILQIREILGWQHL